MGESTKQAWIQPELVVIVRSRPEERILSSCKGATGAGGPSADWACGVSSCPSTLIS